MSDLGDAFREMRKAKQKKSARAREEMPRYLHSRGVAFDSKNNGAHLIVYTDTETIDYWPGTSRWISRVDGLRHFGVDQLLARIER